MRYYVQVCVCACACVTVSQRTCHLPSKAGLKTCHDGGEFYILRFLPPIRFATNNHHCWRLLKRAEFLPWNARKLWVFRKKFGLRGAGIKLLHKAVASCTGMGSVVRGMFQQKTQKPMAAMKAWFRNRCQQPFTDLALMLLIMSGIWKIFVRISFLWHKLRAAFSHPLPPQGEQEGSVGEGEGNETHTSTLSSGAGSNGKRNIGSNFLTILCAPFLFDSGGIWPGARMPRDGAMEMRVGEGERRGILKRKFGLFASCWIKRLNGRVKEWSRYGMKSATRFRLFFLFCLSGWKSVWAVLVGLEGE